LERVTYEIGVGDDLVALVEVAEDHGAIAERLFGRDDPRLKLDIRGVAVLGGKLPLPRGTGGDDVAHRRARAVAGVRFEVDLPRPRGEVGAAGGAGRTGADELDGRVDGGHRDSLRIKDGRG